MLNVYKRKCKKGKKSPYSNKHTKKGQKIENKRKISNYYLEKYIG